MLKLGKEEVKFILIRRDIMEQVMKILEQGLPILFAAIGGLGLFLLGMHYLSSGLQTIAGDRLKWLIGKVTNNRVFAATIGTLVTVIIQSSSITTVMVVGFVNAGIMNLTQAIGVIMGANVGTTITGWIMVVKIGKYGLPLMGIAALIALFAKKEKVKYIATIFMGLGMIFFGLELMKNGFAPLKEMEGFKSWMHAFAATSYLGVFKCILVGAVLTMIVQSSSATLGITIGLATTGVIGFETAAALVLGENIGTTITAFLASFGAKTNAKRAAYAHVIFNILGVCWIAILFPFYITLISKIMGTNPGEMVLKTLENGSVVETFPHIAAGIAMVHTLFNVANTLLFLGFIGILAKFLTKLVPDKDMEQTAKITQLDVRMFETPIILVEQTRKEIIYMGEIINKMLENLKNSILKDSDKNATEVKEIFKAEEDMDNLQKEVSTFLIELMTTELAASTVESARKNLSLCDEYESISDYIMTVEKLRLKLKDNNLSLTNDKKQDLITLQNEIEKYFNFINTSYINNKCNIMEESIEINKNTVKVFKDLRAIHHQRLMTTKVDPLMSTSYMDMLSAYRRIKDHVYTVSEVMVGEKTI